MSAHDEPVCHFHHSLQERYLARHQHQPRHQTYTLYTLHSPGGEEDYKTKEEKAETLFEQMMRMFNVSLFDAGIWIRTYEKNHETSDYVDIQI